MPEEREPAEKVADLEVPVRVVIAERALPLAEILEIRPGVLIELGKRYDAPLDLHVNGALVARGKALDIGERFGFLLEELTTPRRTPPARAPGLSAS
jgi:flagellar motor switch protein FliN/FliY